MQGTAGTLNAGGFDFLRTFPWSQYVILQKSSALPQHHPAELYNRKFQTSPTPRILSQAWIEPILLARQKANGHQKNQTGFLQISC